MISIDWITKIISIPKSDMNLIQSNPFEIRELDLNEFRLNLKDLEDDVEGMTFLDTHLHNTQVDVGGVFLAKVIILINGYSVTFEDGQYAVNLVGANTNLADYVNLNQVSIRSSNSAGLVNDISAEENADAIWNAQLTNYAESGTFGAIMSKVLTVGKFLGLR